MRSAAAEATDERAAVLVVDDERGPRESLQLILKSHFRVFAASSGEQALEIVREHAIDVVTLDLKMPGLSGPETLARIREIDPGPEVVIVTGYGSFDSAVEVLRLRAFDYISKPFETRRILDVVRRAVDARRQRAGRREVERVIPPLNDIVDEVERWQRNAAERLGEPDRAASDRILERLRALRGQLRERLRSLPGLGEKDPGKEEK